MSEVDRTPLQCLNLSVNYVSHWGYLQGLRQLYQNFMDACIQKYPEHKFLHRIDPQNGITIFKQSRRNGNTLDLIQANFISYKKWDKQLILENEKSFGIKCLLMGCSEKGPEALGQFGEGMKVSMIVLLKAGINLYIQSGDYVYYPSIKPWDHNQSFKNKYQHNVLYVKVMKNPKKQDKTRVVIDNIDSAKFQQFLYLSLALLDQTKYQKITFGQSSLIIPNDPRLIGKVYKKGVRLQLHQSENSQKFKHYSYNLDTIQVGRERDCVNNVWDLYKLQSQLHFKVMGLNFDNVFQANNPHLIPKLKEHISNVYEYLSQNNYQTHFFHSYSPSNQKICDLLYQKFYQTYKKQELYPQTDNVPATIARNLMLYGLKPQFYPAVNVSWQQWHTLTKSKYYQSIDKKIETQIVNKQIRQLNQDQKSYLSKIKQKIVGVAPEINQYTFKVKLFKQVYCCKDKNANLKIIYMSPQKISDIDKMARQMCKMLLI